MIHNNYSYNIILQNLLNRTSAVIKLLLNISHAASQVKVLHLPISNLIS